MVLAACTASLALMKKYRLVLLLPVLALVGIGLWKVRFNAEILDMLPANLSEIEALKLYKDHFEGQRELIVLLSGTDAALLESQAESLANRLLQHKGIVSRVIWRPPWESHSEDALELLAYYLLNRPREEFRALAARLSPGQLEDTLEQSIESMATELSPEEVARQSYDPYGFTQFSGKGPWNNTGSKNFFASEDGTLHLMYVKTPGAFPTYRASIRWFNDLKQLVAAWKSETPETASLEISYTGRPAFVAEVSAGMEGDILISVGPVLLLVGGIFWLIYRRFSPLIILLFALFFNVLFTFGTGGLLLGDINAVSIGFAAILIGLTADYGLILYQESLHFPQDSTEELRQRLSPGIYWASLTTTSVFASLQLSSFRGVSQLGLLVAMGTLSGALIMLYFFLPLWMWRQKKKAVHRKHIERVRSLGKFQLPNVPARWISTCLFIASVAILTTKGMPKVDSSIESIQPRRSEAFQAWNTIQKTFGKKRESAFLLLKGQTADGVQRQLASLEPHLATAQKSGQIAGYSLPTELWPNRENQAANRPLARSIVQNRPALESAALEAGFEAESLELTRNILKHWAVFLQSSENALIWPQGAISKWMLEKAISNKSNSSFVALGLIYLNPDHHLAAMKKKLGGTDLVLANWDYLGPVILDSVEKDLTLLTLLMGTALLVMLWLAFRRFSELLLSLAVLFMGGTLLLATMQLLGWKWNLMGLVAIPLMMGAGIDYSIHLQLALKRHEGALREIFSGIGLAMLLCGTTTVLGFASLIWSSNNGLASLGKICSLGIAIMTLVSVFLLPSWWTICHPAECAQGSDKSD